jgi:hypothetical protein
MCSLNGVWAVLNWEPFQLLIGSCDQLHICHCIPPIVSEAVVVDLHEDNASHLHVFQTLAMAFQESVEVELVQ